MKKKVFSTLLVFTLMFSMTAPSFAAMPSTMDDARKAAYRAELTQIVYNNLSSTTNLVNGLLGGDFMKDLVQSLITDLDLSSISELASPALSSLIKGLLEENGITLPDSVNIDEIIGDVLGNEVITSIMTSEFVTEVLNRTITKVFESFDFTQLMSPVLWSIADNLAEDIWRNGNPSSTVVFGQQLGSWNNTTESWNTGIITASLLLQIPSILSAITNGNYEELVDLNDIDIMSMFDMNILLNALLESVQEVGQEYAQNYIEQFKIAARNAFINELNKAFCVEIPQDATNEEIKAIIDFRFLELECQNADKIIKKLEFLKKLAKLFYCGPCDICDCIDSLIDRISYKCVVEPRLIGTPEVTSLKISATPAGVAKITVAVKADYETDIYGNVETKTFTGEYNDVYTAGQPVYIQVGEFTVYVNMKKAPAIYSIKDCGIL